MHPVRHGEIKAQIDGAERNDQHNKEVIPVIPTLEEWNGLACGDSKGEGGIGNGGIERPGCQNQYPSRATVRQ
jgi:hypothetical protein